MGKTCIANHHQLHEYSEYKLCTIEHNTTQLTQNLPSSGEIQTHTAQYVFQTNALTNEWATEAHCTYMYMYTLPKWNTDLHSAYTCGSYTECLGCLRRKILSLQSHSTNYSADKQTLFSVNDKQGVHKLLNNSCQRLGKLCRRVQINRGIG